MKLVLLFLKYSRSNRSSLAAIILIISASIAGGIGSTLLIGIINTTLSSDGRSAESLVRGFAALCVGVLVARFVSQSLLERFASRATLNLRLDICRQILSSPIRQLEQLGAPSLIATLTDDVSSISGALHILPSLCINVVIVLACLSYLAWLSWAVTLAVLGVLALAVTGYQLLLVSASRHLSLSRDAFGTLVGHFQAITEGAKELKLHRRRRRDFFLRLLEPAALSQRRHYVYGQTIFAAASSWGQSLFFGLVGLVIFAVPSATRIEYSVLASFTLTLLYLVGPLDAITQGFLGLSWSKIAMQRIEQLGLSVSAEDFTQKAAGGDGEAERPARLEELELAGVTHAYHSEDSQHSFTLGPIDLTLRPGELVFLIGGNGSGKTTLLKLLTGLYTPEAGEIRLNRQTVDDSNREEFRQYFSVVFSDFYLFECLLGVDDPGLEARVRSYLAQLRLDRKVQLTEAGAFSTLDLSQGQRKRLALLTAYLEDRPVYIFDEWAADQDPKFKEVFYLSLLPELKARGKAVVIISHDDNYYHVADRIVRLNEGKLQYDESFSAVPAELREELVV